jgi:hypothetical protein
MRKALETFNPRPAWRRNPRALSRLFEPAIGIGTPRAGGDGRMEKP